MGEEDDNDEVEQEMDFGGENAEFLLACRAIASGWNQVTTAASEHQQQRAHA